ncbi:ABC transporter ATP-binding protein [Janibacter sp. YIM B02568]|uniref:ATP-binding cassette domain-containing protein n=1 Tax=Janibacter endophyticus TaxID=2806261 RepID=UPI0019508ADF|nr:ABC transporter ATP-binding protein [Janibacter endophyticus]MBM6544618.1 ABC transporter ATP-binding protein [Janibacter endophyticus]
MSTMGIEVTGLSHRFGSTQALADIDLTVRPGTLTGLVGRNGAGKTTLLELVAAHRAAQSGQVLLGGEPVWENPDRTSRVCLMKERGGMYDDEKITASVRAQRVTRPHWDETYFYELLDRFEVPTRKAPEKLSTGKRSALRAALALATRAEVTLLDEVYLGMDAVARRQFYDEVMADYLAHPRTIVLSSHLLDEVEDLLEDVIVLHRGRVVAAGSADEVREAHSTGDRLASLTDVLVTLSSPGGTR